MSLSLRSLFGMRRSTQPGWLALHVQADRIDIAHVVREAARRPRLASFQSYRKEGSDSEALARLRRSLHLDGYRCTTTLEPEAYQVLQVDAPDVPAEEMKPALKWRIKDLLEFPVEEAILDVLEIPSAGAPAGRARLMFAVAARRPAVAARVQPFHEAHLALAAVDVAEMAQRNLATLFEEPPRGVAMLGLHDRGGLLTFTRGGELYALRRMEVGAGALADTDPERRQASFERIGLELQRSLDHFDRQFSHVPLKRLLVCPGAGVEALVAYLGQNLFLPVELADLGSVVDLDGIALPPGEQGRLVATLGLALRDES